MPDSALTMIKEHSSLAGELGKSSSGIEEIASVMIRSLKAGNKVMICGNGGSAADSQHFAAELSGRFRKERKGLSGLALTTDTSAITAISNDYSFDKIFSRQLEALGKRGDIIVLISTSGNSPNLLDAANSAKKLGFISVGLLGKGGGRLKALCDHSIVVPSNNTPRIQEMHTLIIHILCEIIDNEIG